MLLSCRKHQAQDEVCKGTGKQKLNGRMVDLVSPCGKGKEREAILGFRQDKCQSQVILTRSCGRELKEDAHSSACFYLTRDNAKREEQPSLQDPSDPPSSRDRTLPKPAAMSGLA